MVDACVAALERPADKVEKETGDAKLIDRQDKIVEAVYVAPFSDQAPMESLNGTALVTADRVEVWHPAQNSKQAFWVAADESGMEPGQGVLPPDLRRRRLRPPPLRRRRQNGRGDREEIPGPPGPYHLVAQGAHASGQVSSAGGGNAACRARQDRHAGGVLSPTRPPRGIISPCWPKAPMRSAASPMS